MQPTHSRRIGRIDALKIALGTLYCVAMVAAPVLPAFGWI